MGCIVPVLLSILAGPGGFCIYFRRSKKVVMGVLHLVSVGVLLVLVANVTWGLGSILLSQLMDQNLCIMLLSFAAKSSVILFLCIVLFCVWVLFILLMFNMM